MIITNIAIIMIVGALISLLFVELTGAMPSGIVVPGYIALMIFNPASVFLLFLISILIYIIINHILSRFVILYGKRKFTAMMIVGIILKLTFIFIFPGVYGPIDELVAVGVVLPGLIGNSMQKQGVFPVIASTASMSIITLLISFLIIYFI